MDFIKNLYRRIRNFVANQFASMGAKAITLLSTASDLNKAGQKVTFVDYLKVAAGFVLGVVAFSAWYFFIYAVTYALAFALGVVFALVFSVEVAILIATLLTIGLCIVFLFDMLNVISLMMTVKLIVAKVKEVKEEVVLNDFVPA